MLVKCLVVLYTNIDFLNFIMYRTWTLKWFGAWRHHLVSFNIIFEGFIRLLSILKLFSNFCSWENIVHSNWVLRSFDLSLWIESKSNINIIFDETLLQFYTTFEYFNLCYLVFVLVTIFWLCYGIAMS